MKAALESDPRPRYVVIKEGMDHGPFSAVELLQQIASGSFIEHNVLRDAIHRRRSAFIKDWESSRPFAEQAKLNRDIVQEKEAARHGRLRREAGRSTRRSSARR